jgi:hypothetical protein
MWSPSTIYHHLNLLTYPPPATSNLTTHCTYFTLLSFIINIWYLKGCLNVFPQRVYFTLVQSTPSIALPYPFTSYPHFFESFQYTSFYPLPLHLMWCDITDALSSSFPFPFSPSFIEQFHCYKHVLHMSLYLIMLAFVYMFIFCICVPCMRGNMQLLSFWAWLTSLNMMSSSNCIHLPSNHRSFFLMAV